MVELEKQTGKWFKVDPNNLRYQVSPINKEDKILGATGWGGAEIDGQIFGVQVDGRTYIINGCQESINDQEGKQKRHTSISGFYGQRWFDVHFDRSFKDNYTSEIFEADDLTGDAEYLKAVQVAIDFYTFYGLFFPRIPPVREIEFSKRRLWADPRNPTEIIRVNEHVA